MIESLLTLKQKEKQPKTAACLCIVHSECDPGLSSYILNALQLLHFPTLTLFPRLSLPLSLPPSPYF
eukprot:1142629-Pelagomonas_calceolata.AAC.4